MTSEADGVMPSRRLELVADQADELAAALADGSRAQHEDGDLLASRPSYERAYRLAEQAGDVQAMAVAALGLAGTAHRRRLGRGRHAVRRAPVLLVALPDLIRARRAP